MKNDNIAFDAPPKEAEALSSDCYFLLKHISSDKRILQSDRPYHYPYGTSGTTYLDVLAQYGAVPFGHNPGPLCDNSAYVHGI